MSKTTTVHLGGREYELTPLPYKQAKAWRKKLALPIATLATTFTMEMNGLPDVGVLLQQAQTSIIESPDTLVELLFDYSPALKKDRKNIEENAFDEELMQAFVEVLKFAYPFSGLATYLIAMTGGKRATK